jgi:uncharacterized protein YlzI (FlbEa/FlbD family)
MRKVIVEVECEFPDFSSISINAAEAEKWRRRPPFSLTLIRGKCMMKSGRIPFSANSIILYRMAIFLEKCHIANQITVILRYSQKTLDWDFFFVHYYPWGGIAAPLPRHTTPSRSDD